MPPIAPLKTIDGNIYGAYRQRRKRGSSKNCETREGSCNKLAGTSPEPQEQGNQNKSQPAGPYRGGPFMNPSYDGGNSPRFFRHFRTGGTSHTEPIFRVEPPVH